MDLPIDPTQNDDSPQELVRALPSRRARQRVLEAAGISMDADDRAFSEALDELTQIQLRRVASQLQFAGKRTVFYCRVPGLRGVSADGATGRVGDVGSPGVYGPEVQTVVSDHDRVYVVCNVPDTGSQTQLTLTKEARPTTVVTFEPRSELVAVRAPDASTADATIRALLNFFELEASSTVRFLDGGFRDRFEDACVDGYSTVRLRNTESTDTTSEIEVRSSETQTGAPSDVRADALLEALLRRDDTQLDSATGLVSLRTDLRSVDGRTPFRPRVTIDFTDSAVTFEQFVPEQVLIAFDDVVRGVL